MLIPSGNMPDGASRMFALPFRALPGGAFIVSWGEEMAEDAAGNEEDNAGRSA